MTYVFVLALLFCQPSPGAIEAPAAPSPPEVQLQRYGEPFPPVDGAATVSVLSDGELLRAGWIAIAWLDVSVRRQECRADPCRDLAPDDATTVLRREAAAAGGANVTLFQDRILESRTILEPPSGPTCYAVGTWVMEKSRGTVWRFEPGLAPGRRLLWAAENGELATVERLLGEGVSPETVDPRLQVRPLHLAAQRAHAEVVRALLRHGAEVDAQDGSGRTPLAYAAFVEPATPARCRAADLLRRAGAREPAWPDHGNPIDFPAPSRCPVRAGR